MPPIPTGTLTPTDQGVDLVLERRFRTTVDEVWATLTESDRTAKWFASWAWAEGAGKAEARVAGSGEAGAGVAGARISYTMTFEEGMPTAEMRIDACEPPHRLAVSTVDEHGEWRLEGLVREDGGESVLTFIHHLGGANGVGDIGPGWEYYLDLFAAAIGGTALVEFDDYYPSQKAYYEDAASRLLD